MTEIQDKKMSLPIGPSSRIPLDVIHKMAIADMNDDFAIGGNDSLATPAQDLVQPGKFQQVYGGHETFAFLFWQIKKSKNKDVILRALASMLAMAIKTPKVNLINGMEPTPVELSNIKEDLRDEAKGLEHVIHTNFEEEEDVTKAEVLALSSGDIDEFGALTGYLFYCANKQLQNNNRPAFYENRFSALTAGLIDDPVIFSADGTSGYIDDDLIKKMNRVLVWQAKPRAYMTLCAVRSLGNIQLGPHAAFASLFFLLEDFGLGQLHVVKLALRRFDWIPEIFPEYRSEIAAANRAQERVRKLPSEQRAFAKCIWGNQFVPHKRDDFPNLVRLCKYALSKEVESFKNLNYGDAATEVTRRFDKVYELLNEKEEIPVDVE